MIPIHELLDRIRWDPKYAKADFRIGYYDRIENTIMVVSMNEVIFKPNNHFAVWVFDDSGEWHMVPLHRIRQVFRDNKLIWERTVD